MANAYTLSPTWTQVNRYDVTQDCNVLISNTGGFDLRWLRNTEETTPTAGPATAHLLRPGQSVTITVRSGNYLWMAARPAGTALVEHFG